LRNRAASSSDDHAPSTEAGLYPFGQTAIVGSAQGPAITFRQGEPMLILVLGLALLAVLVVMVVARRYVGRLTSLATLIATAMLLLWLIDSGMLPGTEGPLTPLRPRTLLDAP
jgi:hypothetical protein